MKPNNENVIEEILELKKELDVFQDLTRQEEAKSFAELFEKLSQKKCERELKKFIAFNINEDLSKIYGATQEQYDEMIESKKEYWVKRLETYKTQKREEVQGVK